MPNKIHTYRWGPKNPPLTQDQYVRQTIGRIILNGQGIIDGKSWYYLYSTTMPEQTIPENTLPWVHMFSEKLFKEEPTLSELLIWPTSHIHKIADIYMFWRIQHAKAGGLLWHIFGHKNIGV